MRSRSGDRRVIVLVADLVGMFALPAAVVADADLEPASRADGTTMLFGRRSRGGGPA